MRIARLLALVALVGCSTHEHRPTPPSVVMIPDAAPVAPVVALPKLHTERPPLVLGGAATWASAHDVGAMRFCPGDRELVSVEDGGALRRYRVDDGAEVAVTPSLTAASQARGETAVDCRTDGVALAIDAAKSPVLVDAKGAVTRPPSEIEAFHAQFAADGSVWALGEWTVTAWNGAKVTEVVPQKPHVLYQNLGEGAVYVEQVYNSGDPANDGVWMLRGGARTKLPGPSGGLDQISVAPDGGVAIADMMVAHAWSATGNRMLLLDQSGFHIKAVAATNKWFIAVDAGGDLVIVARASSKKTTLAKPCGQPDHYFNAMAVAHDDKRVAIACTEVGVRVFDLATRKQLSTDGITSAATGVAWSADGAELETRPERGPKRVWRDGKIVRTIPEDDEASPDATNAPVVARTADIIATGDDDGVITLTAVANGAALGRLVGHSSAIRALAFAPDGRHLASTADDATMIWDL